MIDKNPANLIDALETWHEEQHKKTEPTPRRTPTQDELMKQYERGYSRDPGCYHNKKMLSGFKAVAHHLLSELKKQFEETHEWGLLDKWIKEYE